MTMNRTMICTAALIAAATMSGSTAQPAMAQYGNQQNQYQDRNGPEQYQDRGGPQDQFRGRGQQRQVDDAYRAGYRAGYDTARARRRFDDRPVALVDPNERWRQRYSQSYSYNDDTYYRNCRTTADPAGIIAGALIGGLVGNSVGQNGNRGGATVAGVIVGGALGAAMTRNLDCEDQSYAYKTYYDGFNSGRPNTAYEWRNPRNGHYGNFRVVSYNNDPSGFRCANYSQQIFIQGRPQTTTGVACQQPDGTWAIVG
jgi:surface antigen